MIGMLICGTMNTLVMKYQDDTVTVFDGIDYPFTHPYLQCAFMFLGEFLCMGLLVIKRCYYKSKEKEGLAIPMSPGTK
jgi:hypothetical protein